MSNIRKSSYFRLIVITAVCSLCIAGLVYFFSGNRVPIYDFSPARDMQPVLKIFDKDWYWLVYGVTPEEYSPEFTLKYRTPDRNPLNFGKLIIKVMREGGKTVGFVAYYKKNFYRYKLLYLAVGREFRGKGYGVKLAKYAIQDMFSRGAKVIRLVTRVNNIKSRNLYKKLDFKETITEGDLIYFELRKK